MKNRNLIHKDDWETPKYIIDKYVIPIFKSYSWVDPCPLHSKFNGLEISWGKQAFVNPPYSRKLKEAFIKKAYEESLKGCKVIMLLPVSTSTKIFHEVIYPNAEIIFIKGRVKFKGVNTKGDLVSNKCGMHDSMIVIFKGKKV
jgi:hypothetical protein